MVELALVGLLILTPFLCAYAGSREAGFDHSANVGIWITGAALVGWVMWSRWAVIIAFSVALLMAVGEYRERKAAGLRGSAFLDAANEDDTGPASEDDSFTD